MLLMQNASNIRKNLYCRACTYFIFAQKLTYIVRNNSNFQIIIFKDKTEEAFISKVDYYFILKLQHFKIDLT